MENGGFKELKVWKKAHALVLETYQLTKSFPDDEKFCLTSQIRRSVISVAANITEGQRKTKKNFSRFLDIAIGSLEETRYYLLLSHDLNFCNDIQFRKLFDLSSEVGKMLSGLKKSLAPTKNLELKS